MTLQIHNLFDAFWKSTTDEICPNITFILRTQKHVHFDNFQFSRVNIATMPHYPCRETRYLKVTKFYQDWCDHPGPTFLSILFPFVSQRANSLGFTYKRIQWKIFLPRKTIITYTRNRFRPVCAISKVHLKKSDKNGQNIEE